MNVLAIIPARGGSKGIPRKNLAELAGRPLLAYTVQAARQSRLVTRTVVSTDDAEIAHVARAFGAETIDRPAELSGDQASSEFALLHALEYLKDKERYRPDIVVFLQCTSPLTLAEDIDGTVESLLRENADSALAVKPFHYFLWKQDGTGNAAGINHDKSVRQLRQNRQPEFLETGAVYVMRTAGFEQSKHRFFGKTALYVMPEERCLEIDDPHDMQIAQILMRARIQKTQSSALPASVSGVVFDFDGVFTNNSVLVSQGGEEAVLCNRSDGWGISEMRRMGVPLLVLSIETNPVVKTRCDKLGIECRQGMKEKLPVLQGWMAEHGLNPDEVVYTGNDLNDIPCMKAVGCGVAVHDAYPQVKAAARIVLSAAGGNGAVRELIDMILERKQGSHA